MYPIVAIMPRAIDKDIVLRGYQVPAKVRVFSSRLFENITLIISNNSAVILYITKYTFFSSIMNLN